MARRVKIVQAASDGRLGSEGFNVTTVDNYASFLRDVAAPIHSRFAERNGYSYEFDVTSKVVHPFWMKAHMIRQAIAEEFELIVWLDSDAIWLGEPLDVEFPTVFGMTYHEGFGAYHGHFNAGVVYVNNACGKAAESIENWYAQREYTYHDQNVLNANHLNEITLLDHAWNSSAWIEFYSSLNPKVVAWHGCPERIAKMRAFIHELGL